MTPDQRFSLILVVITMVGAAVAWAIKRTVAKLDTANNERNERNKRHDEANARALADLAKTVGANTGRLTDLYTMAVERIARIEGHLDIKGGT